MDPENNSLIPWPSGGWSFFFRAFIGGKGDETKGGARGRDFFATKTACEEHLKWWFMIRESTLQKTMQVLELARFFLPQIHTPKFNSLPLKNDAWKTILSYWVLVTFQGRTVKLRVVSSLPSLHRSCLVVELVSAEKTPAEK